MKRCWLLGLLLCVSCSGPRIVEFRVRAINTDNEEVSCLIVRDQQVVLDDATNMPLLTPTLVPVTFEPSKTGREAYESVKLGVRAVTIDVDGNIASGLEEGDPSPYVEDSRFVRENDAPTQLYVLRRDKDYIP